MSEETRVQCPACTAELTPETVECPWCGHLMTSETDEIPAATAHETIAEWFEPELAPAPSEPVPELPIPEASVFPMAEPGLTELTPLPDLSHSSRLKVMGIILIIFSLLALVFFIYQVLQGNLPRLVLVVPVFGMLIGLVSVAVVQKR